MSVFLSLYEKALLRKIDMHVVPQIGKNLQKRLKQKRTGETEQEAVSVNDGSGVKGLFRTMAVIMQGKKKG